MRTRLVATVALLSMASVTMTPCAFAVDARSSASSLVEFELMTWVEVKDALAEGKTTALIYTGGVEQRGPQNANGGHNLMARAIVKSIAEQLGNAIAMPVLPFTPTGADPEHPGNIGITPEAMSTVLEQIGEQTILNGFKNVILMGDSGGGQPDVYTAVAKKLNAQYESKGVRVFYADAIYRKANSDNAKLLASEGYPRGTHGGISDTSLMLYLDTDGKYVRRDQLPNALGDPVLPRGQKPDPSYKPINNGIHGDARRANVAIGKRHFENKVKTAVEQIRGFLGGEGTPKP